MQRAVHCGSGNATGDKRLGRKEVGSAERSKVQSLMIYTIYYRYILYHIIYSKDLKTIYIYLNVFNLISLTYHNLGYLNQSILPAGQVTKVNGTSAIVPVERGWKKARLKQKCCHMLPLCHHVNQLRHSVIAHDCTSKFSSSTEIHVPQLTQDQFSVASSSSHHV